MTRVHPWSIKKSAHLSFQSQLKLKHDRDREMCLSNIIDKEIMSLCSAHAVYKYTSHAGHCEVEKCSGWKFIIHLENNVQV